MCRSVLLLFTMTLLPGTICSAGEYNSSPAISGFVENKGQILDQHRNPNPAVKYLLSTPGLNVQLRTNGFSYDAYTVTGNKVTNTNTSIAVQDTHEHTPATYSFHRVDISLEGANQNSEIIASGESPGYANYYTDAGEHSYVRHFNTITYRNIYQNIDLVFKATSNTAVEYDFIIHPGGDPSEIKLKYTGAKQISLQNDQIINTLSHGELKEHIPASYIAETGKRLNIHFKNVDASTFGYDVPSYDRSKTLVIDPTPDIAWGTYYGGSANDRAYDVSVRAGDVYVTGITYSAGNIATTGAHQATYINSGDGFLVKLNRDGVRQWATYYGGSGTDWPLGVAAAAGTVCIAGQTNSTTGIATTVGHQNTYAGGYDGFLAKFTDAGVMQVATYIGGTGLEYATSVAIDTTGSIATILVAGTSGSSPGIPITGATQAAMDGVVDAFLVKFSMSGFPVWGTYAGSGNIDEGYSVTTDTGGNVFLAGITYQPTNNNLYTTGAQQTVYGGDTTDYFIQKYNRNGVRQWGTYFGGPAGEERVDGEKLATDVAGNLYFGGSTLSSTGIATPTSHQPTKASVTGDDGFLAKFNPSGVLQWSTYYGGTDGDLISGVTTDNEGNVYAIGYTFSITGITTANAYQSIHNGNGELDLFLVKFNSAGSRVWATYYGGTLMDVAESIDADSNTNIYLAGFTTSQTAIATTGAHQTSTGGAVDAVIARFRACNGATIGITTNNSNVSCFGAADGEIDINASNATHPYIFKLGTGSFQTNGTFPGLDTGTFTVTVRDDLGCEISLNQTITQPVQITPPTLTGSATVKQKNNETYATGPQLPGAIFVWTVTGGNITAGQGTSQITVNWTKAGPGEVKVKVSGSAASECPDSTTLAVFIDFPDDINDPAQETLSIYPNPVTDMIHIEGLDGTSRYTIHNQLGLRIAAGETNGKVPADKLAPGTYYLRLHGNTDSTGIKFIKY